MPTTKSLTIQNERNLQRAIKYILNPEKTMGQTLTSGYKINYVNNADFEMKLTRKMARLALGQSNKKSDQEVVARHIIQSFDPNDNLTPEEIHEIGRQTVLELTGGNHEFVIATHVDQDHYHNHIIFNATSSVDLKKFRWQKGTTNLLRNISDKIADYHGAMILDAPKRTSHAKYEKYKRENNYRQILKERLDFLLRHSINFEDFKQKAHALNIQVDELHKSKDYGQVINYQLTDFPQQRPARDYTLNKKSRKYSFDKLVERFENNHIEGVYHVEQIKQAFQDEHQKIEQEPDLEFVIQPWQIEKDTMNAIYVRVEYGRYEEGVIKIPDYKLDKLEDGSYKAYFKNKDSFYFINDEANKSKFLKGAVLSKILSGESGTILQRKNSAIQNVREMVAALNLISERQVNGEKAVEVLGQKFMDDVEQIKQALQNLDAHILKQNEQLKYENPTEENKLKIKALQLERKDLQAQYQKVVKKMKTYDAGQEIVQEKLKEKEINKEKTQDIPL